jgi:hypothetical protein
MAEVVVGDDEPLMATLHDSSASQGGQVAGSGGVKFTLHDLQCTLPYLGSMNLRSSLW